MSLLPCFRFSLIRLAIATSMPPSLRPCSLSPTLPSDHLSLLPCRRRARARAAFRFGPCALALVLWDVPAPWPFCLFAFRFGPLPVPCGHVGKRPVLLSPSFRDSVFRPTSPLRFSLWPPPVPWDVLAPWAYLLFLPSHQGRLLAPSVPPVLPDLRASVPPSLLFSVRPSHPTTFRYLVLTSSVPSSLLQ